MIEEEWRPVPDFSNYEISSLCRVRNSRGKILRPVYDPTCRYVRYCFRYNGRQLTKNAHRLMWRAFHGDVPDGMQLNHKDGNRLNNEMANLELVSPSANTKHAFDMGLNKNIGDNHHSRRRPEVMMRGERHGCAKLKEADAKCILARLADGAQQKALAREFGVSETTIYDIKKGISWAHLTRLPR